MTAAQSKPLDELPEMAALEDVTTTATTLPQQPDTEASAPLPIEEPVPVPVEAAMAADSPEEFVSGPIVFEDAPEVEASTPVSEVPVSLLSPKAKPFFPRTAPSGTPTSTPLSPKAKPFYPRPHSASFSDYEAYAMQSPLRLNSLPDITSLTSPIMMPLVHPPNMLASPFTPNSTSNFYDLSRKTSSSNMLAPTREQARAKELGKLEALWLRRTTPTKPGDRPPSPVGNVLTSPETWSAVNWWSPCNKPLRHLAVQADLEVMAEPQSIAASTEAESAPASKKLFLDAESGTEASDVAESTIPREQSQVETAESETMTQFSVSMTESETTTDQLEEVETTEEDKSEQEKEKEGEENKEEEESKEEEASSVIQTVASKAGLQKVNSRDRVRSLLRIASGVRKPGQSSRSVLRQIRSATLAKQRSLGGFRQSLDDMLNVPFMQTVTMTPAESVAAVAASAPSLGDQSPTLRDLSLPASSIRAEMASTVRSAEVSPTSSEGSPLAVEVSTAGAGPRVVIRMPRSKAAKSRDRKAGPVQITAGGITIDVFQ